MSLGGVILSYTAINIEGAIASYMRKLDIEPVHPKDFRKLYGCTIYQMHRWSGYSINTLKNWLSDESSTRYEQPKKGVLYHFGTLHQLISNKIVL